MLDLTKTVFMNSPYGRMPTPDGGAVLNGTSGQVSSESNGDGKKIMVRFGKLGAVPVPEHWLSNVRPKSARELSWAKWG